MQGRVELRHLMSQVVPCDALEADDIAELITWIDRDAPLYRYGAADQPPRHLISYVPVLSSGPGETRILLVDHRKAKLWLPTGGHVDPGEHPRDTAVRECAEELGQVPTPPDPVPAFVTLTQTRGPASHQDASLWYPVTFPVDTDFCWDRGEFHDIRWFSLDDLPAETDPQLRRFLAKWAAQNPDNGTKAKSPKATAAGTP